MNYDVVLDMAFELGYRLAMCGAETYRVEESISRVLDAYNIKSEVFSIPNLLIVTIETEGHHPMTRTRRIGYHGSDLDSVERFNNLSRKICAEKPDPAIATEWLQETSRSRIKYHLPVRLIGSLIGAAGYAVFFGGGIEDSICAGICGLLVGLSSHYMDKLKVNQFFSTILCAFVMSLAAYAMGVLGLSPRSDSTIIGTLMILVPGLLFTNALRDIIFGDTNSGINRIVQVLLVAAAIGLGTGLSWSSINIIWTAPVSLPALSHSLLIQSLAAFVGCIGFCILFNIHGFGCIICAIGGGLAWAVYGLTLDIFDSVIVASFFGTLLAAGYSEAMARIRKYPAISYLVISIFPLLPGAGIYYTTSYLLQGEVVQCAAKGGETIGIAGALAVGILIVSTTVRLFNVKRSEKSIR